LSSRGMPRQISGISSLLLVLATAFLLRAVRGYRPFPSIDDFVYIPLARAAVFPELFPRDVMLQEFVVHAPVWTWAVWLSERSIDLASLFWLLTMVLSIATVAAALRLLRALGADGVLVPLLCWIAFSGRVNGLMRGQYDGALGDAFHVQWLALCLLLWAYVALVERRALLSGALLGLAAISHPVVAAHGAFVILLAALLAREGPALLRVGLTAAVVSAPVSLPLVYRLAAARAETAVPAAQLIQEGYLFRAPHEYSLDFATTGELAFLLLAVLAGAAGAALLLRGKENPPARMLAGILLGHVILAATALLVHGPWAAGGLFERSTLPFLLHLSRTSPLLLVVGAALALAAVESGSGFRALRWALGFVLLILLLFPWSPAVVLFALLTGLAWLHQHLIGARRWTQVAFGLAAAVALGRVAASDRLEAVVPSEQRALYSWVRARTTLEAMFIVPPGFQEFRTYTDRGAYVDFKLFASATPSQIPEWRRRLELIAAPDSATVGRRGWPGLSAWDSSYARHNTPGRIAALLGETGMDYFVLDLAYASPADSAGAGPGLSEVYSDGRYRVFRLRGR
jgi:hypothetical protein